MLLSVACVAAVPVPCILIAVAVAGLMGFLVGFGGAVRQLENIAFPKALTMVSASFLMGNAAAFFSSGQVLLLVFFTEIADAHVHSSHLPLACQTARGFIGEWCFFMMVVAVVEPIGYFIVDFRHEDRRGSNSSTRFAGKESEEADLESVSKLSFPLKTKGLPQGLPEDDVLQKLHSIRELGQPYEFNHLSDFKNSQQQDEPVPFCVDGVPILRQQQRQRKGYFRCIGDFFRCGSAC